MLHVVLLQMTSVGKNHKHNKQPHHMETHCCWCHDRNRRWQQQRRWRENFQLPSDATWTTPYVCDWEEDDASVWQGTLRSPGRVMENPFELPSHPKWVCIYTTPQATLHRLAQTDESIPDGGDSGGTKQGLSSTQSSCLREAIPDLITMVWSSEVEMLPDSRTLVDSSSPD